MGSMTLGGVTPGGVTHEGEMPTGLLEAHSGDNQRVLAPGRWNQVETNASPEDDSKPTDRVWERAVVSPLGRRSGSYSLDCHTRPSRDHSRVLHQPPCTGTLPLRSGYRSLGERPIEGLWLAERRRADLPVHNGPLTCRLDPAVGKKKRPPVLSGMSRCTTLNSYDGKVQGSLSPSRLPTLLLPSWTVHERPSIQKKAFFHETGLSASAALSVSETLFLPRDLLTGSLNQRRDVLVDPQQRYQTNT